MFRADGTSAEGTSGRRAVLAAGVTSGRDAEQRKEKKNECEE